ncbi:Translin family-domain-containing protein [Exophiala viscosa]|uniref:Translin family-domain-containing protein n=1 Tax=Exophiala viscosa TaxID=2486360 RepID=A0AAN6DXN9_9EURO|nr:Translin family-domain-containing protein [Exophiala viscosa]
MPGTKRSHDGMEIETKPPTAAADASPYIPVFETFRSELDEHHDRRERIIKASRDVTAQSKKIIFALQRVRELERPIHASIAKQISPMYNTIRGLLEGIVPDLQSIKAYRYQGNISGGIQEYMEAVLFQHYLETRRLMTYEDAARQVPQGIMLTYEDYALGLFDMTGELMRFAITYMATNGQMPGGEKSVLADLQMLRGELEALDASGSYSLNRDFAQKMKTTRSSVEKVENGVYSMIVRGKERPKGWRPDTSLADGREEREPVESY